MLSLNLYSNANLDFQCRSFQLIRWAIHVNSFNHEPVIVLNLLFRFLLQVTWRKLLAILLTLCSSRAIREPAWSLCSSLSHLKSSTSSSEHLQHYSKRYGYNTSHYLCSLALRRNRVSSFHVAQVQATCLVTTSGK